MSNIIELRYRGSAADDAQIQFYDVAQSLIGFERVISLTTHLLINGTIKTQSPSTQGFQVLAQISEEGSWKQAVAVSLGTAILSSGVASSDSSFGWLMKSAVSYVIAESLGFEPNFEEVLGSQIREHRNRVDSDFVLPDNLTEERFDAVIEKCESGILSIHRPIAFSRTANIADINFNISGENEQLDYYFDINTYDYVKKTITSEDFSDYHGIVSSYNVNTYKGRFYIPELERTVSFELGNDMKNNDFIAKITDSLARNALSRIPISQRNSDISFRALRNESINNRLKSLLVIQEITS
ncbi:hypothetical protein FHS89_000333 [Rubricella aquisinus]|uniref:Uncharacterized protein n=1 Tax=Rubricella aquisinus TaxID=2028108 RepID=A0A840WXC9_9RHOB|nr:hypothetical protein [Rubricella aquisinus]MBB5514335.1 hypothetical protein [Rubricella aquisinus]